MSEEVRAHAIIKGKVQGVFFRLETRRAAESYDVCGWVKNRRDGSVEAVFEGYEDDVNAVLEWCKTGSPHASVKSVNVEWEESTGEFNSFEITY